MDRTEDIGEEGGERRRRCISGAGQRSQWVCGVVSCSVSWRYARGIITSDDRLFSRLKVPRVDRVVLDPISERHAGTSTTTLFYTTLHHVITSCNTLV